VICCPNDDARLEADEIDHLLARQVDGLILASAQPPESSSGFERIEARKVPSVLIDRSCTETHAPYVGVRDEAIGRFATSHLIDRRFRRVAHLSVPPAAMESGRLRGYRQTLWAAGFSVPEALHNSRHQRGEQLSGYAQSAVAQAPARRHCHLQRRRGSARYRGHLGRRDAIPEQIKVIGVGNEPYSNLLRVPPQ
jgi:LacI family transcriptional regulator